MADDQGVLEKGADAGAPGRVTTCPCCGYKIRPAKAKKLRSSDQLRRYFKVVFEAWLNWPERTDPETGELKSEFADVETFRKWIQMKAGYFTRYSQHELEGRDRNEVTTEIALAVAAAAKGGGLVAPRLFGSRMVIFVSESIAYPDGRKDGMEHLKFCKLASDVEAMIKVESGLDPDTLLEEAKRRVKT